MRQDIILVSELFYPDKTSTAYIMTKIADKLSNSANLTVISGDHYYNGDIMAYDIPVKSYDIIRVNSGSLDKNGLLSRIYRMVSTSLKLSNKLLSIAKPDTEVIIVTNPAPFLIFAAILKKIKKFKLSIIVQDVFPENAVAAGLISSRNIFYRALLRIWENSYSKADRLIVCGRDMKDIFTQKLSRYQRPPKISIIENWADKNSNDSVEFVNNESPIEILFAGNIGRCQGIETILEIAKEAKIGNIIFKFRGDGAAVPFINDFISDNPKENVVYGGRFSRDEQFSILEKCDIALVTLTHGMLGLGVPSKSYNIMAAGKPILYIGDEESEIALVIKEYGIGYCFNPNDKKGIIDWLESINTSNRDEFRLKGLKAKQLAESIYSEDTILEKYPKLFFQ